MFPPFLGTSRSDDVLIQYRFAMHEIWRPLGTTRFSVGLIINTISQMGIGRSYRQEYSRLRWTTDMQADQPNYALSPADHTRDCSDPLGNYP